MRIGFTGTRSGMTERQRISVRALLVALKPTNLHHGDCIGADNEVHALAVALQIQVVIHPPIEAAYRAFNMPIARDITLLEPKEYIERNHDIVDATTILIATPKAEESKSFRSGTWATVRYARKLGRDVRVVMPDGRFW